MLDSKSRDALHPSFLEEIMRRVLLAALLFRWAPKE